MSSLHQGELSLMPALPHRRIGRTVWASMFHDGGLLHVFPVGTSGTDGGAAARLRRRVAIRKAAEASGQLPVPLVVTANRLCHTDALTEAAIQAICPTEIVRCGGTGRMLLDVVEGRVDCYFYPHEGTKKWDTAAGEALIRCMGGIVLDAGTAGPLSYEPQAGNTGPDWRNVRGVVAAWDARLLFRCMDLARPFLRIAPARSSGTEGA